MHRVTRVTQEDEVTINFATKIWGKTKEFTAKIDTQRPDERIKWEVSQGITHAGVVTFHELAPNLTRIEVTLDIDPGSLLEKAARGMRDIKRAVRADLARYKAFIEMQELETGAWRGVIEGGEVVEPHDDSYDEERDYSDIEDEDPSASGEYEEAEPAKDEEPAEETVAASDEDDERRGAEERRGRARRENTVAAPGHATGTAAAGPSRSARAAGAAGSLATADSGVLGSARLHGRALRVDAAYAPPLCASAARGIHRPGGLAGLEDESSSPSTRRSRPVSTYPVMAVLDGERRLAVAGRE